MAEVTPSTLVQMRHPRITSGKRRLPLVLQLGELATRRKSTYGVIKLTKYGSLITRNLIRKLAMPRVPYRLIRTTQTIIPTTQGGSTNTRPQPVNGIMVLSYYMVRREYDAQSLVSYIQP